MQRILLATKRGPNFAVRLSRAVKEVKPQIIVKLCWVNYQSKILEVISKEFQDISGKTQDLHFENLKEQEVMFNLVKAVSFVPPQYTELA